MSNDFISRSALMEEISSLYVTCTGLRYGKGISLKFAEEYKKSVLKCIDEAPTVYDVDEVLDELKRSATKYCICVNCNNDCEKCEHAIITKNMLEIVRNGGKKVCKN